ncbi:hypothetical protein ACVJGD_006279 [Bradyrhizobium sp. USDA 10063]
MAANSDPKVKEVLSTFVLEPPLGFRDSNALYQRELPVWMESAQALGLQPSWMMIRRAPARAHRMRLRIARGL